jgi:molybdopterin converting factor subunit 1
MRITVRYFASLRDQAQCEVEQVSAAGDAAALYESLRARHGFSLPRERLRVARNGQFTNWDTALVDGDEIVFIPPVSGG